MPTPHSKLNINPKKASTPPTSFPPIAAPSLGAGVLVVPFESTTCVCVGVASVVDIVLLVVSVSMVAASVEEELNNIVSTT